MLKSTTIQFGTDTDLVEVLHTIVKGSSLATMEVTTSPKMNVKHRDTKVSLTETFKGKVFCTSKRHINLNVSYENAVNNQLNREGKTQLTFSGNSLPYGKWVDGLENVCVDTGKAFQLRTYIGMNANSKHDSALYHYECGTPLTMEELKCLPGFLPVKKVATNQGTDKEVKCRNYGFRGIMNLKAFGVELVRK